MNTFEQFTDGIYWTTLELSERQQEEIFVSVVDDAYATTEEIEGAYPIEDYLVFWDVNLHSVVENFSEIIDRGKLRWITFYYLAEDDIYAGVLSYDG